MRSVIAPWPALTLLSLLAASNSVVAALASLLTPLSSPNMNTPPCFVGEVVTEWMVQKQWWKQDRKMRLLVDFLFIDSDGEPWLAPKDYTIDGASIPSLFWPIVGSPFIGDYRRASVVHDYYADDENWKVTGKDSEQVHAMFYEGMLCDGVCPLKAKLMYEMILTFGGKWTKDGDDLRPWWWPIRYL